MMRTLVSVALVIGAFRLLLVAVDAMPASRPSMADNPCPRTGPCFPALPRDVGGIRYIPDPRRILVAEVHGR